MFMHKGFIFYHICSHPLRTNCGLVLLKKKQKHKKNVYFLFLDGLNIHITLDYLWFTLTEKFSYLILDRLNMVTKKKKGLAQLIRYWLLQIELVTCMYVMDPTEKALFCILALKTWTMISEVIFASQESRVLRPRRSLRTYAHA